MKIYLIVLLFVLCNGCTTAPLTEPHTAKTLGKDGREWAFSLGYPGYLSIGYTLGWTEKLDVGGVFEIQGIGMLAGLQGKYMLSSQDQRDPWAMFFGAGLGTSTRFAYAGPIKSFRFSPQYELALGLRYNIFKWDIEDFEDQDDAEVYIDDLFNEIKDGVNGTYSYLSFDISNTYWLSYGKSGFTLSVTGLAAVEKASGGIVKVGLKYHSKY